MKRLSFLSALFAPFAAAQSTVFGNGQCPVCHYTHAPVAIDSSAVAGENCLVRKDNGEINMIMGDNGELVEEIRNCAKLPVAQLREVLPSTIVVTCTHCRVRFEMDTLKEVPSK
jgi:hypothetical protein